MTKDAFLQAIREAPQDDSLRLVYADWLTDHGEGDRGEFIRVQVELARLPPADARRSAMQRRERELLNAHEAAWRAELPSLPAVAWGPFVRGFAETMHIPDRQLFLNHLDGCFDDQLRAFALACPHGIRPLSAALIDANVRSYFWHRGLLSYLPEGDWPALVEHALAALAGNGQRELPVDVLEEASRQCPAALHPHLDTLFTGNFLALRYQNHPWRNSGQRHSSFLSRIVEDNTAQPHQRLRAFECLLETRDPAAVAFALSRAEMVHADAAATGHSFDRWRNVYLAEVGMVHEAGQLRRVHGERVLHLVFPPEYLGIDNVRGWRQIHPTWRCPVDQSKPLAFGGTCAGSRCSNCNGAIHHLLTLDPVPEGLGVTGLPRLQLGVCLSCLGWERSPLFYVHDSEGQPSPVEPHPEPDPDDPGVPLWASYAKPQFPTGPLKPTSVYLGEAGQRWHWQEWGASNACQNLHRIGGPPTWVQSAHYATCPRCGRTMSFLMQLDSNLPLAGGDSEWLWGSGGMGYGSWCDECRVSGWFWQCT
jgi:uncharacterized protein (TIGR02996 family)